jgi:hypothetical protein
MLAVRGGVCVVKTVVILAVASLVLLLSACGSQGGPESSGQASPVPTGVVSTAIVPTAVPAVLPTVGPDVPLTVYESPNVGYSIGYPEDWWLQPAAAGGDSFVRTTPEGKVAALLTVNCYKAEPGWTPEDLMTADAKAVGTVSPFHGTVPTDIEVAGVTGKERRYSFSPAATGFIIEHVVAYFISGDCGWRIGLASYGENTLDPYIPLFDRILASFRLP